METVKRAFLGTPNYGYYENAISSRAESSGVCTGNPRKTMEGGKRFLKIEQIIAGIVSRGFPCGCVLPLANPFSLIHYIAFSVCARNVCMPVCLQILESLWVCLCDCGVVMKCFSSLLAPTVLGSSMLEQKHVRLSRWAGPRF